MMPIVFAEPTHVENEVGSFEIHESQFDITNRGELIKVYGNVTVPKKGGFVAITVLSPDGTLDEHRAIVTEKGSYETFVWINFLETGSYEMNAKYFGKLIGLVTVDVVEQLEKPELTDESNNTFSEKTTSDDPEKIPSIFDSDKDSKYYIMRYMTEPKFKEWFDNAYPDFTFYNALGITESEYLKIVDEIQNPEQEILEDDVDTQFTEDDLIKTEPKKIPQKETLDFVKPGKNPKYYVERYMTEPKYKEWFHDTYPGYTIYDAVGLDNPETLSDDVLPELTSTEPIASTTKETSIQCGKDTVLENGLCVVIDSSSDTTKYNTSILIIIGIITSVGIVVMIKLRKQKESIPTTIPEKTKSYAKRDNDIDDVDSEWKGI